MILTIANDRKCIYTIDIKYTLILVEHLSIYAIYI